MTIHIAIKYWGFFPDMEVSLHPDWLWCPLHLLFNGYRGFFAQGRINWISKLVASFHLVQSWRMHGAVRVLPLSFSFCMRLIIAFLTVFWRLWEIKKTILITVWNLVFIVDKFESNMQCIHLQSQNNYSIFGEF